MPITGKLLQTIYVPGDLFSVNQITAQNVVLQQGEEAGYFKFGSTVIVLLPEGCFSWENNLQAGHAIVMGQKLAG